MSHTSRDCLLNRLIAFIWPHIKIHLVQTLSLLFPSPVQTYSSLPFLFPTGYTLFYYQDAETTRKLEAACTRPLEDLLEAVIP